MLHNTKISIICAMDSKRGIGKNNDLLFKIPEDMKRFRSLTRGRPVIMGRRTFDSLRMPKGLPNRTNIIVTRDRNYKIEGAVVVYSLEEALEECSKYYVVSSTNDGRDKTIHNTKYLIHTTHTADENEIFILGGGQIFKEALEKNLVDKLYLTLVEGDFGADTFFPQYKELGFKVKKKEGRQAEGYTYTFIDLEKE